MNSCNRYKPKNGILSNKITLDLLLLKLNVEKNGIFLTRAINPSRTLIGYETSTTSIRGNLACSRKSRLNGTRLILGTWLTRHNLAKIERRLSATVTAMIDNLKITKIRQIAVNRDMNVISLQRQNRVFTFNDVQHNDLIRKDRGIFSRDIQRLHAENSATIISRLQWLTLQRRDDNSSRERIECRKIDLCSKVDRHLAFPTSHHFPNTLANRPPPR